MTIPGVGAVVALSYVATVDVAARFARSKAVGAVFGLTPSQHQSGEVQRQGHVSLCGDAMMRALLYEAAHVMLFRSQKWSWLKAWAMKIVQRRGANKAIVALARRLAVVMHRMWVDGTTFRASRRRRPRMPEQHHPGLAPAWRSAIADECPSRDDDEASSSVWLFRPRARTHNRLFRFVS